MRPFSAPLVKQTVRWLWRASTTRSMICILLMAALLPKSEAFQSVVVFLPLVVGSQGVGASIRQDCMDLVLCRPLERYQFVFSKWLAFTVPVVLACLVHAMSCIIDGQPLARVGVEVTSLLLSGAVSAAVGAMMRIIIIIDPRRQGICIFLSLAFGFSCVMPAGSTINSLSEPLRHLLYPASLGAVGPLAITPAGALGSLVNIAVALAVGCLILYRQEFSYSID